MRDLGINIERNENNEITFISMPDQINMGWRTIRGLDININFNHPIKIMGMPLTLLASTDHSHFLENSSQTSHEAVVSCTKHALNQQERSGAQRHISRPLVRQHRDILFSIYY